MHLFLKKNVFCFSVKIALIEISLLQNITAKIICRAIFLVFFLRKGHINGVEFW